MTVKPTTRRHCCTSPAPRSQLRPCQARAFAQSWPSKPIRVIVPLTAGSATDVMARLVVEQVSAQLGQPMMVENRPGAGNTIGMGAVAKADPDGYTILANSSTHTVTPATRSNLGFDMADLAPIIPLGNMPVVMCFNPSKGYKKLSDFVAAAKANPGSVNYASAGAGNSSHLNGERFRLAAGFEAVHLPFKGAPEAMTEVIAGRADFYFSPLVNALPFLKDGQLQALGGERLRARLRVAGRADHGGSGLSQLGIQFLGRHVRAGEDARRHPRQALCRNREGAGAPAGARQAQEPRRRSDAAHLGAIRGAGEEGDRDQHPAREGGRDQGELTGPTRNPMLSRRHVVVGAGVAVAGALLPARPRAEPGPDGFHVIRARTGTAALRGEGQPATPIWGYQGVVPGPTLRVKRGEEVRVRLVNELPEPTVVHWHGVRLPNAMDGVPHLTQPPIAPGASFDYRFRAPDAGTFWYHSHLYSSEQLERGLYGALIVEEPAPVAVDRDIVLVLDDWRLTSDGKLDEASFRSLHDAAHDGRIGAHLTVNSAPSLDIPVQDQRAAAPAARQCRQCARPAPALRAPRGWVMAIDGQPAEPFLARNSRVTLGPGNRIDVFVDAALEAGASAPILVEDRTGDVALGRFAYERAEPARPQRLAQPAPLPPNPLPARLDFKGRCESTRRSMAG